MRHTFLPGGDGVTKFMSLRTAGATFDLVRQQRVCDVICVAFCVRFQQLG